MSEAPVRLWKEVIRPDWTDYNGHLNEAFYVLVFSHANDAFMGHIGIDPDAPERRTENSVYTLESHIRYLMECKEGAEVQIATRLLDYDTKRYHCLHEMYLGNSDTLLATGEMVLMHIDMTGPRAAPLPPEVVDRLHEIKGSDDKLPASSYVNGAMGLKRK